MRSGGTRMEERLIELRRRAKRGDLELALCSAVLVLAPEFLLSILIVWILYRSWESSRMIGAAWAWLWAAASLGLASVCEVGSPGFWIFIGLGVLKGAAGAVLAFSPNVQAYQELKRNRGRVVRVTRRIR